MRINEYSNIRLFACYSGSMIHQAPPISDALAKRLTVLDELTKSLAHEANRVTPWDGLLRRAALTESVTSSTAIEGYSLDDAQASLLMGGMNLGTTSDAHRAVACYAHAMAHVAAMSDDPSFEWLGRVILDLHFDACSFQSSTRPGRWRTGPVYIRSSDGSVEYTAPDSEEVPNLIHQTVRWLETGDLDAHVAVRAAMAHLHVVSIHPFSDGNGRASRLVQSLVLARAGILAPSLGSIEPYLAGNTSNYYAALQHAHGSYYDPTRDATEWVSFCVEAHIHQASRRIDLFATGAQRWSILESVVQQHGWPDRIVIALEQALHGGTDRTAYANEAGISPPTANQDFLRLQSAGLIIAIGKGRSTRYLASMILESMVEDVNA